MPLQLQSLQRESAEGDAAGAAPGHGTASQSLQLRTGPPMEAPLAEEPPKGALGLVGILGGQSCQPAPEPAAVKNLLALCPPGTGRDFVCYVLQGKCLGDLEVRGGALGFQAYTKRKDLKLGKVRDSGCEKL